MSASRRYNCMRSMRRERAAAQVRGAPSPLLYDAMTPRHEYAVMPIVVAYTLCGALFARHVLFSAAVLPQRERAAW